VADFVASLRSRSVSPHIAIDGHLSKTGKPRKTSVDGRVTRHIGYAISQHCRKRIEEVFGWVKTSAGSAKVRLRGRARVDAVFTLAFGRLQLDPVAQAPGGSGVSVVGRWHIVKMPNYTDDYPDMMGSAYILFESTRGEFAFGRVTGAFTGGGDHDAVGFD
jgi:hypothetical protein